jgi:hypothetical protein
VAAAETPVASMQVPDTVPDDLAQGLEAGVALRAGGLVSAA